MFFKQSAVLLQQKGVLLLQVLQGSNDFTILLQQPQFSCLKLFATSVLNQRRTVESKAFDREPTGWRECVQGGVREEKAVCPKRLRTRVP